MLKTFLRTCEGDNIEHARFPLAILFFFILYMQGVSNVRGAYFGSVRISANRVILKMVYVHAMEVQSLTDSVRSTSVCSVHIIIFKDPLRPKSTLHA